MFKTLWLLLGNESSKFQRYVSMALLYGLLSGLTITLVIPIIHNLLMARTSVTLYWLCALFVGLLICWYLRIRVDKAGIDVGVAILKDGRHRLGSHVAKLPIGWFNAKNTAQLSHTITNGVMEIAQLPAHVFTPVFSGLVVPLVIIAALFSINWKIGVIALLSLPIMGLSCVLAAKLGYRADKHYHHATAQTSHRIIEFAQAQSMFRAFNGEGTSTQLLEQAVADQTVSARKMIGLSLVASLINTWVVQGVFAALLIGTLFTLSGDATTQNSVDSLISTILCLLLINRFVEPLLDVSGYGEAIRAAGNQLKEIQGILDVKPLAQAESPKMPIDYTLELIDVGFRYFGRTEDVLRHVNLRIEPGTMTALLGPSGAGKTTLFTLISRFFDVTSGQITIGGVDLRDMSETQLRDSISQVFQAPYLFQMSIAQNIRMGKPNASDDEVFEVAQLAGVSEILERLPEGLDTQVGEGGARLSGGERQRISIARALIKDAPILLIDEATAALDTENQDIITQTLSRLRGKKTLLVITHQLSTIEMADQIVILENAEIKEQGTHAQLAESNGRYQHYLSQQRQSKSWRVDDVS